jgi:anti-sigma regulatory factor (Ser/Thr protein kinase)
LKPALELKIRAEDGPDLRILMLSRAENVALVRRAIEGAASALKMDELLLIDVMAATSEACNNVVLHAYGGMEGLLEVYLCPSAHELEVVVRDEGFGIQPKPILEDDRPGVGLMLIHALTDTVEFRGATGEGTEVRMRFRSAKRLHEPRNGARILSRQINPPAGDAIVSAASGPLARAVFSRVLAMAASRANFPLDRVADMQLIGDVLAAHAPAESVGRHLHIGMERRPGGFVLRVGPLEVGGAEALVHASEVNGTDRALLEQLTVGHDIETGPDGELLRLDLAA